MREQRISSANYLAQLVFKRSKRGQIPIFRNLTSLVDYTCRSIFLSDQKTMSRPGLFSPLMIQLRKRVPEYNASLRRLNARETEYAIIKRQPIPVLRTPQPDVKDDIWRDRQQWLFEQRIDVLGDWQKGDEKKSIVLEKLIQEEWERQKKISTASEIKELEETVAEALEERAKVDAGDGKGD